MRVWNGVVAAGLLLALLAGCLGGGHAPPPRAVTPPDLGHDPAKVQVVGVQVIDASVVSWDGVTHLATRVYLPTLSDGAKPVKPPVVVFVHGWGNNKESYEGNRSYPAASPVPEGVNHLQQFADAGMIAVAYDARGFGKSEGMASVAGPAEMADLHAVIQWAKKSFATNDLVGVIGASYGGGHSYNAIATDPLVTTVVPMYGWVDLYQALVPNNVPKLEWAQSLYLYGQGGTGKYDLMVHEWYLNLYQRQNFTAMHHEMDERSSLAALPHNTKPMLVCQGMEESLFPQIDQAWTASAGFTRAYVFRGGHGSAAPGCWDRAVDWFRFFLLGYDTRVDAWPALETVDAQGDTVPVATYATFPSVAPTTYHLRSGSLYVGPPSDAAFTIQQTLAANPLEEPSALWDQAGMPSNALPSQLRQDPAAITFATEHLGAVTLLGAPWLNLTLHGEATLPFQVAGTLYVIHKDGTSQELSTTAGAPMAASDVPDGVLHLRFHWTKAELHIGDQIQVKLASNDPAWWMPLLANYSVTFDGRSTLDLPLQP